MTTDCTDHGHTTGLLPGGYKKLKAQSNAGHCLLHRKIYAEHAGLDAVSMVGQVVRHVCDNPRCVKPTHLLIGTMADNNRDRMERDRGAKIQPSKRRLTYADAAHIRAVYIPKHKEFGQRGLSRLYGVNHGAINHIINGRSYFNKAG